MADYRTPQIAIKVEIVSTKGSTPRDKGAVLWVLPDQIFGSIGGGNMENDAISIARKMPTNATPNTKRYTLGPETGQCCGGIVDVEFSMSELPAKISKTLAIFGAGHVGAVLARLGRAIGYDVQLYDARPTIEHPNPEPYTPLAIPEMAIKNLPNHSAVAILTHDHGLDFLLTEAALREDRFALVGMIGSKSKAAKFKSAHADIGEEKLAKLISPIGKRHSDKRPEAVALDILSEILFVL